MSGSKTTAKGRAGTLAVAAVVAACAGPPSGLRGGDEIRARARAAAEGLPPAPGDALWGDGFGPTQHEAVLDARRAVSEQITSQVASIMEARASEETGGKGEYDVHTRVRAESRFEHAELIEIVGTAKRPGGFVARAALDRDRAAKVYRQELAADAERLRTLAPVVEAALDRLDTSILLSREHSPGYLLAEQRRKRRILMMLDRPADEGSRGDAVAAARTLERRAAAARQQAVLRLRVEGDGSPELRKAVVGVVGRALRDRGCRLVESGHGEPPPDGVPAADVTLRLRTRDHTEVGVRWRYVGLELVAVDARSGKPVLRYSGLPEIAHGGGKSWSQADQAVARRLREVFEEKAGAHLDAVTCR